MENRNIEGSNGGSLPPEMRGGFSTEDLLEIKYAMQPPAKISSQVNYFGYDVASASLCVEYQGGGTYIYKAVPVEKFEALKASESAGKYIAASIKPVHKFVKGRTNHNLNKGE